MPPLNRFRQASKMLAASFYGAVPVTGSALLTPKEAADSHALLLASNSSPSSKSTAPRWLGTFEFDLPPNLVVHGSGTPLRTTLVTSLHDKKMDALRDAEQSGLCVAFAPAAAVLGAKPSQDSEPTSASQSITLLPPQPWVEFWLSDASQRETAGGEATIVEDDGPKPQPPAVEVADAIGTGASAGTPGASGSSTACCTVAAPPPGSGCATARHRGADRRAEGGRAANCSAPAPGECERRQQQYHRRGDTSVDGGDTCRSNSGSRRIALVIHGEED
jgi:hypothetical protein